MRIALVTYALQVGGVETFLMGLARDLVRLGHEVSFVETYRSGQWSQWFEEEGFRVLRIPSNPWQSESVHARRVAEALRGFHAVVLNDAPVAQAGAGLLDDTQVVIVVLQLLLRTMLRNAAGNFSQVDALVAVSPQVAEGAERYGVPKDRITFIPNAVSVPEKWPKRDRPRVEPFGCIKAVFLGSLSHVQKGVLHLPGIVERIRVRGLPIRVDVIGDGRDRATLQERIQALGLEAFFALHGHVANVRARQMLAEADLLLLPSYFEGMPLVLLEAMAAGVVPVASLIPGCTDFAVHHGESGLLVQASDEEGFAAGIVALFEDPELLARMSKSAWERALNVFSVAELSKSYLDLIGRCHEARRRRSVVRSGKLQQDLLGDLPAIPLAFVRPVRKALRLARLMPSPREEPLLF